MVFLTNWPLNSKIGLWLKNKQTANRTTEMRCMEINTRIETHEDSFLDVLVAKIASKIGAHFNFFI
jgi:hypothetical protein